MTKTAAFSLAAALVVGLGPLAASAQAGQRVIVEKNHMVRITLPASAGSVIVGNPDIADVTVIDSRTVFVTGHDFGDSSVAVTDRNGRTIFDGEIIVTSPTQGAITVYKGLTPSRVVCSNICTAEAQAPQDPFANLVSSLANLKKTEAASVSNAGNTVTNTGTVGAAAGTP